MRGELGNVSRVGFVLGVEIVNSNRSSLKCGINFGGCDVLECTVVVLEDG